MKKLITLVIINLILLVNIAIAENTDDYRRGYQTDYQAYGEFDDREMMMRNSMMDRMKNDQMQRGEFRDFREMPFPEDNFQPMMPGISRSPEMWQERLEAGKGFDQESDRALWFEMRKAREKEQWGEKQQQIQELRERNPWTNEDRQDNEFDKTQRRMMNEMMPLFNQAVNPRKDIRQIMMKEIKEAAADEEQCNNPEQLLEKLYIQLTEDIDDLKKQCDEMSGMMATCRGKMTEMCEQRSKGFNRGMDPMMSQCPPDKEKMIEACIKGSRQEGDQRCEQEWEINQDRIKYTCEGSQECDEDRFMQSCMNNNNNNLRQERYEDREERYGERGPEFDREEQRDYYRDDEESRDDTDREVKEEIKEEVKEREKEGSQEQQQSESAEQNKVVETLTAVTGNVIYETRDMKDSCQQRWKGEKERCNEQSAHCSKESYLELCMKRANPGMDDPNEIRRYHCDRYAQNQLPMMMRFCDMNSEFNRGCKEQAEQTCSQISQQAQLCQEQFNEDELKTMLRRAIEYHCKLKTADVGELPEGSDLHSVKQMIELMRQEFPDEQEEELETEMTELLTVLDEGKDLEQAEKNKPLWYKFRRLFGFLEEQEQQREVSALREIQQNIDDLEERITDLTAIMQELDSEATQQRLQTQIDKLQLQKQRLEKQADKLGRLTKNM